MLDGQRCVIRGAPTGPRVQGLRVTKMVWEAQAGERLEVNHRLPVSFEVTAVPLPGLTPEQGRETVPVEVDVFLVRRGAGDLASRRCDVGGDVVLVERGGDAGDFSQNLTIPAQCLAGGEMADFDLLVELNEVTGVEGLAGVSQSLLFTQENVMNAERGESACRLNRTDNRCAVSITVTPAMGTENFTHTVSLQSNVGVLWNRPAPSAGGRPSVEQPA